MYMHTHTQIWLKLIETPGGGGGLASRRAGAGGTGLADLLILRQLVCIAAPRLTDPD
jgi:hypothetical protein